ncbi:MAG: FprA family A-type flavoprotein [Tissierellia bacterium]|nr:FprA family A-type flavoprotein [Tissierellia bacterium]
MYCVRNITDDLYYVGGNDHRLALFENIFPIPDGVSYNSYLLMDEKTVLVDTADWSIARELLRNVDQVLDGRDLDYLIVNHMEPDHGASIELLINKYPNLQIISTEKSFMIMRQFGFNIDGRIIEVDEGDTMNFGKHTLAFVKAPMVHWPEVMMTFDTTDGVLFSADAFGSFKANDGKLFNDEVNFDRDWLDEARRYYTNIVGKYGPFVQDVLKKAATLDIKYICPLHGLVWRNDFGYFIDKYDKWSRYEPEEEGVMIVYASMYGNTEFAAQALATKLCEKGMSNVVVHDVSNTDVSVLISDAFKYSHIVLASVTYNLGVYPKMKDFIEDMRALNLQNRTVSLMENGSWAPQAAEKMEEFLDDNLKLIDVRTEQVSIASSLSESKESDMDSLVDGIIESMEKIREEKEKTLEQNK